MAAMDTLLSVSLYAAVIFCGIMVFRKVLKNKLSPALQYGLWFLLAARLVFPFTLESGFHFVTLPAASQNAVYTAGTAAPATDLAAIAQPVTLTMQQVVLIVWLAGIGVAAACMLFYAARLHAVIRKNAVLPDSRIGRIFEECKQEAGIKSNIPLRLCAGLGTPALTVSFRPKLLLPVGMEQADDVTLRYAMLHELTHCCRGDHLMRILMNALKAVWWFNPVVWLADRHIIMDMETACDSTVVKRMEQQEKKQYANTVLTMFSQEKTPKYILGMALGNSKQVAEQRIRGIYMKQKTKRSIRLAAVLLAGILLIACFTTACSPVQAADKDMEPQESAGVIGGADGPTEIDVTEQDTQEPQPTEMPQVSGGEVDEQGVRFAATLSPMEPKAGEKAEFTLTVENNSGKTIRNCRVEIPAVKEGQIGDTFTLADGQSRKMQWTTTGEFTVTIEALFAFEMDGKTYDCAVGMAPYRGDTYAGGTATEQPEQPAPAVEPTPQPSMEEGPVPTPQPTLPPGASAPILSSTPTPMPTPAPSAEEESPPWGNVPRPTADPGPVPTPTPTLSKAE